ncbi:hypothetical protein SNE40_003449 [Patella caerulea]|uniref:PiggyBac transposable element-derived protein domain-containing protein n=1 Tax=Patella caerulea TaxID=87958 RepID=A0AAN8Q095_PATCE
MIPYYGRHSPTMLNEKKNPIRYGYKVWDLNTRPGYLIQYNPYRCAGTDIRPKLGMGGSVVVDLLCKLPARCDNIYFDNLITSLPLIEALKEIGKHGIGTVRQYRLQACPLTSTTEVKKKDRGDFLICY